MKIQEISNLGDLAAVPEVRKVEILELEPGESTTLTKNGKEEFLVVVTLRGCGAICAKDKERPSYILAHYNPRIVDFRDPDKVILRILREEEGLCVMVLHMTRKP